MLNWMHVVWMTVICAAAVLGCFHFLVWLRQREQSEHALVAALCFLVAVCGHFEMRAFLAVSPAEYAAAIRWGHTVAQLIALVAIGIASLHAPGRRWLVLSAIGARLAVIAANHGTGASVSFLSIDALRPLSTFGGAIFMVPVGTVNPWFALLQLSNLLLLVYLIDRMIALARKPASRQRRRGLQSVGALLLLLLFAASSGISVVLLGAPVPMTLSIAILGFAVIASIQLADDLLEATELARRLRSSTASLDEVSNNLRLVEESAGLGLWHWEAVGNRLRLSDRAARIVARGDGGEIGLAEVMTAVDPQDQQRVRAAIADLVRTEIGEFSGQFRLLAGSGARRWIAVHGRIARADGNTPLRAHGVLIDVTDHHSNDAIFVVVFEASPSAMLLVDESGRIALANQAAAELTGYPVANLLGMAIDALVPPESQAGHQDLRRQYGAAATRRQMRPAREVQLLARDGTRKVVEVTLNPVNVDGRTLVIAIVFDVTGRRQQEREQAMQRAALAHVARVGMLAELSGSLAHEINQPLAAILSNAQASQRFLGRNAPDLEEVKEGLGEIVDSAKRAGEVIRRLRAMLRNDPPEFDAIDVRRKVRDVIQLLHSELVDRNVHVVEAFADDVPMVRGDQIQLQQVLINLIVNAADAMTDASDERTLTLTVQRHAEGALIEVCDVGSGIPEGDIERIFQAFVSSKANGLGFGLPLCRTLVQAHAGRLWASNNHGPGATFHVLLPAAA